MRPEAFERVEVTSEPGTLPLRSIQDAATAQSLTKLILLSGLATVVVLPQLALAFFALTAPETRATILAQPDILAQLAACMALWIAVFAWPLQRLFNNLTRRRVVEITAEGVSVADTRAFGDDIWNEPMHAFAGVAHHIRSSLAGVRHELVLVHPDRHRSVLLMTAPHISEAEVSWTTRNLNVPRVAAAEMYTWRNRKEPNPKTLFWQTIPA